MLGGASGSVAAASGSSAAPAAPGSEIVCRVMCSSSDEGVKHLFLRQNQSVAVHAAQPAALMPLGRATEERVLADLLTPCVLVLPCRHAGLFACTQGVRRDRRRARAHLGQLARHVLPVQEIRQAARVSIFSASVAQRDRMQWLLVAPPFFRGAHRAFSFATAGPDPARAGTRHAKRATRCATVPSCSSSPSARTTASDSTSTQCTNNRSENAPPALRRGLGARLWPATMRLLLDDDG